MIPASGMQKVLPYVMGVCMLGMIAHHGGSPAPGSSRRTC